MLAVSTRRNSHVAGMMTTFVWEEGAYYYGVVNKFPCVGICSALVGGAFGS
jgi:hypothetical protein